MKRLSALLIALLLVVSLSSCNNSSSTPPADSGNTETAGKQTTTSDDDTQKLTVWCWDPTFNIYAMQEAAKVYQETHPGFELEVQEVPWEDIQALLITTGSSGDFSSLPDIFLCQNNAFQKNVMNFPDMFTDITNSEIPFSDFGESSLAYSTIDNKNYGVPFDNGTAVFAIRTDVIGEAGYTLDDFTDITWADYITQAGDVLAKTGKPLMSGIAGETDNIMMMLQSVGSSLFNGDGTPNIKENEELKVCMEIYIETVQKGLLIEVNSWDEYISSFTNEAVAGTVNGCWILGSVQSDPAQAGKWGVTNIPKIDTPAGTNFSANGGSSWAISSSSKNPELAKDFLKSTFAGSVEFYETILPSSGAIANYLPAGDSAVYQEPQEFFNGEAIYARIVDYGSQVPDTNPGPYYYEARDAVGVALTQTLQGTDIDVALEEAQNTVEFAMSA